MGLFSSKKKTVVGTSVVRVIEDDLLPDSIKTGVTRAIFQNGDLPDHIMEALVGSMTGGLAVATVAVATFWGAVSGSGPATVAALGLILIPGMAKAGYDKAFATATVSVTSGLAIVIPPSIAFIV